MDKNQRFVLWFDEITIDDVSLVGGKNASLGEMYTNLTKKGVRVPYGFAITTYAYKYFIKKAEIELQIKSILKGLNARNVKELSEKGRKIRDLIMHADFPPELKKEIKTAYQKLSKFYRQNEIDVAVRSSASAEDLPTASFAGQQETFLNIKGEHELIDSCKKCFASLFTNRAIAYRQEKSFDHLKVYLSIGVQKMVRSDLSSSGVMFTIDTETGFKDAVLITGIYGLGENIVQGAVNPDEFYVFKPTLMKGFKPIISKVLGEKNLRMVYSEDRTTKSTKNVDVPASEREQFCINDEDVLKLAEWGCIIEEHYSQKREKWTPMDIEWAKDGELNELFIVQARPETVQSQKNRNILEEYSLKQKGKILATGKSVGSKIGQGTANVIKNVKDINKFRQGQVLVTEMTDPDWVPVMRLAKAIITNRGGKTCHAAIISRELGIPCIVGTNNATEKIKNEAYVTADCSQGEEGTVYEGLLKFDIKKIDLQSIPKTKTKIMINIGNPEEAFEYSKLPVQGVGLAREEFIINEYIKVHPMALMHFDKLDEETKQQIQELTKGYKNKIEFFVEKLAMGIGMIASAFYPNDVIVRMSDFKSNEYANLIGGKYFEPKEDNPMIGWRGAARYYTQYREGFELECKALKKAREEFGLTNIKIMIPMCRTIDEGKKVLEIMAKNRLKQGKNELQVYVMCEIPSNVILAEEFCQIFDGFSIGSNDLTQFTLGVDRDSELVAHVFDERNQAVKKLIKQAIETAKKNKKKIGICGDAPSSYPEFAEFLVECGIDSISLSPDAVLKTIFVIAEKEKNN